MGKQIAHLKTLLLLDAKLLENGPLIRSRFEVTLMSSQLDPWIPLLLVRLEERGPLHYITQLPPSRRLQKKTLPLPRKLLIRSRNFIHLHTSMNPRSAPEINIFRNALLNNSKAVLSNILPSSNTFMQTQ